MVRLILAVFVLAILWGCAATNADTSRREAILQQPADYREGYRDGCTSGYYEGGHPYLQFTRDNLRLNKDALYAQGWKDGFAACKEEYIAKNGPPPP